MLELVAATTILAIALVPALKLTRSGLMNISQLERSELSVSLCVSKLEEELARTAATWDLSPRAGNFAAIGRPELRFTVAKSDAAVDGGSPNSLAVIDVIVWHDEDGGNDLDGDETHVRYATKIAKVISYEYESTIH
tara:strand:- start:233517 stop:233927 length:411 start_codon:yes stop_codon:yes gene_type:complete